MTTPYNHFAPYFRKVPVEGKNVGTSDIPAFSCVEIVEADRPEESSTLTFGGGRTIFHVKAATRDSPPMLATVGPVAIPVNQTRPVFVTNESYVRYTGTVEVGDAVGPIENTLTVRAGQKGFYVAGDIEGSSNGGTCRVVRAGAGEGGLQVGVLTSDVPHLGVQNVQLLQQSGTYESGDTAGPPAARNNTVYRAALNITSLTLRSGTVAAGPYMYVQTVEAFDMPLVFPAQIEECYNPLFRPNNNGT